MPTVLESDLDTQLEQLADQMITSYEGNDSAVYRTLFAPGAVVWLSYMDGTMPAEQNADLLGQLYDGWVETMRYDDIRRRRTADGYVQQHTLTIVAKSGSTISIGACSVVHITDNGLIARLDEYLDTKILQFGAEQQATTSAR